MVVIQENISLQASSACTSDWISEQVKGGILYAYDLSTIIPESQRGLTQTERIHLNETKKRYQGALEQLSRF
jgi:hypothetical protein